MNLEEACDVICFPSQLKRLELNSESQRAIDDLATASHVKAKLAMDPITSNLQFEVTADRGAVSIKGGIHSPTQAEKIGSIVRTVPGVKQVHLGELALAIRF